MKDKRIVIKIGTSSLTHDNGSINLRNMDRIVRVVSDLDKMGHEIIVVSSGAIAVGTEHLKLPERPKELRMKQAAASVGQCRMMHIYDKLFSEYSVTVAQILLTGEDVEDPRRTEHLSNTFSALLENGIVPIVNENDSVSSAEIETGSEKILGDNDTLSAIVARLCSASLLVILSDVDGLYDADPHSNPDAKLISTVAEIDESIMAIAGGAGTWRGTGGMTNKMAAAKICMNAGFDMAIINGKRPEDLYGLVEGKKVGTRFIGRK